MKHQFEDSGDDYDMDLHNSGRGRIILLGDGAEILTDGDEEEDDKDVEMQSNEAEPAKVDGGRTEREETPGPESQKASPPQESAVSKDGSKDISGRDKEVGDPQASAASGTAIKAIPESVLPDKIVSLPSTQET